MTSELEAGSPVKSRRQMRWWMPALIVMLGIAGVAYLHFIEVPFFEPALIGVGLLTALLLGTWFIFFTGLRWKTRGILALLGVLFLAGAFLVVKNLTRVEGSIGGSGIPRLVWKWNPRREGATHPVVVAPQAVSRSLPSQAAKNEGTDFPQFLGPDRSGMVTGVSLARDWDNHPPETVWRQPIGLGWSAFAISGPRAITQEQRQEDELVVCYGLLSGNALWAHTNQTRFSEALGGDGPRATPTIRQGRVYAMGGSGILDCLEETTGKLIWSRDVLRENGLSNLTWGKSCSPLLVDKLVVVTGGEAREKTLLAYHADTGEPVWQAGRDRASYSSPTLVSLSGQEQILIVNGHSVTGHDPEDGKILWEYEWPAEYAKVTQPLVIDSNRVLIAAGYGVGCVMLKVERAENGAWSVTQLWRNRNMKPKFTNLVRKDNYVYGLDEGVLVCLNLEDGNREWKEGRYGHGQILLVNDLLLVQAESGEVVLVEITPEAPRVLSRFNALKGKTWNNPVLVGDLLLVRNDQEAACYRLPLQNEVN